MFKFVRKFRPNESVLTWLRYQTSLLGYLSLFSFKFFLMGGGPNFLLTEFEFQEPSQRGLPTEFPSTFELNFGKRDP